jgi:hypothetical protein
MSALRPIPDSRQTSRHVRKVPKPEVTSLIQSPRQRGREGAGTSRGERFRRLEVDDERVLGGLLNSAARERLGMEDLNMADMAQGALFHLSVCIPVRPNGVSVAIKSRVGVDLVFSARL